MDETLLFKLRLNFRTTAAGCHVRNCGPLGASTVIHRAGPAIIEMETAASHLGNPLQLESTRRWAPNTTTIGTLASDVVAGPATGLGNLAETPFRAPRLLLLLLKLTAPLWTANGLATCR